eukprot:3638562-Prymnesium_polylepis.1
MAVGRRRRTPGASLCPQRESDVGRSAAWVRSVSSRTRASEVGGTPIARVHGGVVFEVAECNVRALALSVAHS